MSNVEKLKIWGILRYIRVRLGETPESTLADEEINNMTPDEILEQYAVWVLGDNWWYRLKQLYDYLNK